ncbi:carbohydrate-binding module family 13 protein [Rhizophagus clarus]|uniref:Carbohydrate-binding module family 13 protein n=1 Tax=Rhizophagus clarus TaxID=94130 RepID=A0A8H3M9C6_9GLOM|nr:carbohydrate-binding module family 13 protein [Rhizophagus clarus]
MEYNKLLPTLSQNLLEILDDVGFYDIIIEVDDGTLVHIKLPNILPEIFQIILRYIYGGSLSLENYDDSDIIKILVAANELGLQELVIHLQTFLIKYKKNWMEQNFNLTFQTSFENASFLKLQSFCKEMMSKEPEKIFNSIDFNSISEKFLISLIQHENIQMDVIQVWEHVLKWGIAQNPELPSDFSDYSKDDFDTLKKTLQECIPFIKFYNLTSEEFLGNVYPFKKIISKELREPLVEHFLNPVNQTTKKLIRPKNTIDSRIIAYQHSELISKWVDRLESTDEIRNPYEFKLILRGSCDGFSPSTFHELCDNQSHTITIIKVKESDEILGGYNPNMWKSGNNFSTTKDSFIFSFKDKDSTEDHILSRVKEDQVATYNITNYGPTFANDLVLYGNNFYDKSISYNSLFYDKSIRETEDYFSVEEYEVFQIMKD